MTGPEAVRLARAGPADSRVRAGRAFARALTLSERLPAPAGAAGLAGARAASRRLALWRGQPPFDQEHWWQARLRSAGLTEPELRVLLGEPRAALAMRCSGPGWTGPLSMALLGADPGGGVDETFGAAGGGSGAALFAPVVAPLLAASRAMLRDRLERLARDGAGSGCGVIEPGGLTRQLAVSLDRHVHRILLRTLVSELRRSRQAGELAGSGPAERFAWFVTALREDAGRRRALFTGYPVLARQLVTAAQTWVRAGERLAADLAADAVVIGRHLAGGRRLGVPCLVEAELGDRHRGGRSVALVGWPDGTSVVYKPRPMGADVHFQGLLGWVNDRGGPGLRMVGCLDRGDHGWMEFVAASPCPDERARRLFYRRQGALLALLYLLGASDVHAENLIAAGEHPVLVDLETVLQPGLPAPDQGLTAADAAAAEAARGSVMAAGLLPQRSWIGSAGEPVDLSGMGYPPGQQSPLAVAAVRDAGLDTMRLEVARVPLGEPAHRPADAGAKLRLLDYAPDILDGFTEVYRLCARHRAELGTGPLAAFADDEIRVVVRPTMWYATILSIACHPAYLADALDRDRLFDTLWRDAPARAELAGCIPHELADLWRDDIPVFTTSAGQEVLYGSVGEPVAGFPLVPAMDRVRARLAALGAADLARQRWLITAALGTTAIDALDPSSPAPRAPESARGVGRRSLAAAAAPGGGQSAQSMPVAGELLASADAVGQRLGRIAFTAAGSVQWIGANSPRGAAWSLGPLGPDLFHGLTGVALFLGWLGELTGDGRHTRLARQAVETARAQLSHEAMARFGGMAGIGGLCYALAELGTLWSDEALAGAAERHAQSAAAHAAADVSYDFVGGSAGTIAGLAAVHQLRPSAALRDGIRVCANRLLATAIRVPEGLGWLSDQIRRSRGARLPIAGFAHGNAGIILALLLAADILHDESCHDAALQALRYEQALFDHRAGTWAELGDPGLLGVDGTVPVRAHWCYGGPGIALSRLRCLPLTEPSPIALREIDAAVAAISRVPVFSHCLCHGALGNAELLLQAAAVLNRPVLRRQAERIALDAAAQIRDTGWKCGMPLNVETPGLMSGLAGIGYGMLRVASPDRLPAVLTLQPGPASVTQQPRTGPGTAVPTRNAGCGVPEVGHPAGP